jgi:hypothetical protein
MLMPKLDHTNHDRFSEMFNTVFGHIFLFQINTLQSSLIPNLFQFQFHIQKKRQINVDLLLPHELI